MKLKLKKLELSLGLPSLSLSQKYITLLGIWRNKNIYTLTQFALFSVLKTGLIWLISGIVGKYSVASSHDQPTTQNNNRLTDCRTKININVNSYVYTAMAAIMKFDEILRTIQSSNLNFHLEISPFSAIIHMKKTLITNKFEISLLPQ